MTDKDEAGAGAGQDAFALCELEWLRQRMLSQLVACDELAAFVKQVGDDDGFGEVDAEVVARVRAAFEELEDVAISLGERIARLPSGPVRASAGEVEAAAAGALVDGIADQERAAHAARWIGVEAGPRTLAALLSGSDSYRLWEIPVAWFMAAFRGSDPQVASSIASVARLGDATFAELTDEQIVRLAGVLRRTYRVEP